MPQLLDNPGKALAEAVRKAAATLTTESMPLREFVEHAWRIIEPATELKWNWHHDLILEHLEAVYLGQIKRLVLNGPPRDLKSTLISITWPVWCWTMQPWMRFVFSSYAQSLATDFSVKRRRIIKDQWYQERWGALVSLVDDKDLKTEFENSQTGHMLTTSTDGTATGKGGDVLVIDDPQNPKMAESEAERKAANDHYSKTLVTRLNDKKKGAIVLGQQRLHHDDTTALVLQEGGWTHLCLQSKSDSRKTYSFPLSPKRTHTVLLDEHLNPAREGEEEFVKMRQAMGTRTHDAQYQQKPSSETGNIWKRHWWRFYKEIPGGFDVQIQSWDAAFKETPGSSYVVGQVWGLRGAQKYLLAQTRARMDYPATKKAIQALTAMWPRSLAKLIEDKANGPALIADLTATVPGIIPIQPVGDKVVRANAVAPTIEAGDVWLPDPSICEKDETGRPWIETYIEECAAFPESKNNDQVDATSQALVRLNELALTLSPEALRELQESNKLPPNRRVALDEDEEDVFEDGQEVFSHA